MASASRDIREQLSCITECSVCSETYNDPRQLPCIHTYCLQCVTGFTRDKQPGDEVPCPLCRKDFKIPPSGVTGLPINFFVEQLKDLLSPKSTHCEVCSSSVADETKKEVATMFCVECSERQCDTCATSHSRMKFTRDHNLIRVDEKVPGGITRMVELYCNLHKDRPLELYCFDCTAAICMMCFVKTHKTHQCSDVNEVADEFRNQMTGDIGLMAETLTKCRGMIEEEKKKEAEFCTRVDEIGREICDRVEKLKQSIDEEREKLLDELRSLKADRMMQISNAVALIEQHVSFVESLAEYTKQLRDKGTASDVAQQMSSLHSWTTEMVILKVLQKAVDDLDSTEVTFTVTCWPSQSDGSSVVGELHRKIAAGIMKSGQDGDVVDEYTPPFPVNPWDIEDEYEYEDEEAELYEHTDEEHSEDQPDEDDESLEEEEDYTED